MKTIKAAPGTSGLLSAVLLLVAGLLLLTSCLLALIVADSNTLLLLVLRLPGDFLLLSFHAAAFLLPAFFFLAAFMAIGHGSPVRALFQLSASALPFLTLSLVVRLLFDRPETISPITDWAIAAFGRFSALGLFCLLTIVQIVTIVYTGRRIAAGRVDTSTDAGVVEVSAVSATGDPLDSEQHAPSSAAAYPTAVFAYPQVPMRVEPSDYIGVPPYSETPAQTPELYQSEQRNGNADFLDEGQLSDDDLPGVAQLPTMPTHMTPAYGASDAAATPVHPEAPMQVEDGVVWSHDGDDDNPRSTPLVAAAQDDPLVAAAQDDPLVAAAQDDYNHVPELAEHVPSPELHRNGLHRNEQRNGDADFLDEEQLSGDDDLPGVAQLLPMTPAHATAPPYLETSVYLDVPVQTDESMDNPLLPGQTERAVTENDERLHLYFGHGSFHMFNDPLTDGSSDHAAEDDDLLTDDADDADPLPDLGRSILHRGRDDLLRCLAGQRALR